MGKIRVATLGDEAQEQKQQDKAKARREAKKLEKAHTKGVGLKGGQKIAVVEGVELKPEFEHTEVAPTLDAVSGEPVEKKKPRKIKVRVRSKRYKGLVQLVDKTKTYSLKNAVELVKKTSNTSFNGTVEAHINLNPATLPKDKLSLSGTVNLPHGTGKTRKIIVADEALIEAVQKGKIDFDVVVAHPSLMPKLAKVAKILGPRGLMPNPKNGTVSVTPEKRAKELEGGELNWKTEPDHPVIHQIMGKVSFNQLQLEENIKAFVKSVGSGKIAKLTLNCTMGPGIKVDVNSI